MQLLRDLILEADHFNWPEHSEAEGIVQLGKFVVNASWSMSRRLNL